MSSELQFSSIEKIQEIALKNEEFRKFLLEIENKNIDFKNLDSVRDTYSFFDIFVCDETLKIDSNIQEGGFYFINGDLVVNGYIQGFGATILHINGNIMANQVLFADTTYVEKDVIVNEAYLVDTDSKLTIKGELKTKLIYSSLSSGKININFIDPNIKGFIIRDSYDEMGYQKILDDLGLKEVIEDEEYEWHLTI